MKKKSLLLILAVFMIMPGLVSSSQAQNDSSTGKQAGQSVSALLTLP